MQASNQATTLNHTLPKQTNLTPKQQPLKDQPHPHLTTLEIGYAATEEPEAEPDDDLPVPTRMFDRDGDDASMFGPALSV